MKIHRAGGRLQVPLADGRPTPKEVTSSGSAPRSRGAACLPHGEWGVLNRATFSSQGVSQTILLDLRARPTHAIVDAASAQRQPTGPPAAKAPPIWICDRRGFCCDEQPHLVAATSCRTILDW